MALVGRATLGSPFLFARLLSQVIFGGQCASDRRLVAEEGGCGFQGRRGFGGRRREHHRGALVAVSHRPTKLREGLAEEAVACWDDCRVGGDAGEESLALLWS